MFHFRVAINEYPGEKENTLSKVEFEAEFPLLESPLYSSMGEKSNGQNSCICIFPTHIG